MIEKDKRHNDVTLIQKEKITERAFLYWSMGFDKIDAKEVSNMDGLNDFLENDFTPSGFASHKNIIGPLLSHLRGKLVKQVAAECHEELPMEHDELYTIFAPYYTCRRKVFGTINGYSHSAQSFGCAFHHL